MAFEINGASPSKAPHGDGYIFHEPEPSGENGAGEPVGAVGYPWVEITYKQITTTDWNWWITQVGSGNLFASKTNIQVWNPFKSGGAGWQTFATGILHRPTYQRIRWGQFEEVMVRITQLVAS